MESQTVINLDTHVLVFALFDQLHPKERKILQAHSWGISAIVLWELAKLIQLKRIELDLESSHFQEVLRSLTVWPVDAKVSLSTRFLDFKSDPADELISATSIVYKVPLVTRDRVILKSKTVPLVSSTS